MQALFFIGLSCIRSCNDAVVALPNPFLKRLGRVTAIISLPSIIHSIIRPFGLKIVPYPFD
jgi:hypothetical protein